MLDIRFIRENPELVRENIKKKFQDAKLPLVDEVLELDEKKRAAITEASELRAQRNTLSKQVGMLMGQAKKDPSKLEEAEAAKAQVKANADRLAELEQKEAELEQKIRMLLEREHIEAEQISIDSWEKLVLPGLTLDGMTHEVSCNGRKVSLTRLEFDLLLMLASHEGQIFSKEELFCAVWGQNCDDTLKVVANTVSNLRKKLAGCGSFIRTTHGGYAFVSQKENDPA